MKKLYALAVAAFAALSASAAAGDWLTVEDFENNPATPGLFSLYGQDGSGTVTIETVATTDNADNHAAKFTGGDYNTGVLVTVTLPEGKTIADYKAIDFDVFNYNMTYKSIFVYVDGKAVREPDGNDIGGDGDKEAWKHFMYELSATAAGSEVQIGIGFKGQGTDAFAVDNIRLQERGEAVAPGTYDETKNGTTTEGWLMLQDYQTKTPGDMAALWGRHGSPSGTGEVAADPDKATNLVAVMTGGDYNTYMEVNVTLPEGKTLKDYKTVAFDLYRFSDDENHKKMMVWAGSEVINEDDNYIEQAPATTWTTKSYTISEASETGNSFLLHFGISSNNAHYAVDNVRLEERTTQGGGEDPEPEDFYESSNGTVTDGVLMVNDFQHHNAVNVELPTWARDGSEAVGTAVTAADPTDKQNITARFTGGNYNTVHELDVTLPEGKTLANYSAIIFDLYRNQGDANYKKMRVQADDEVFKYTDYIQHAPTEEWTEQETEIPADTQVGNSFKLRLGIESDEADYLIDNIRLLERPAAEIELVGEPQINISHAIVAGAMTVTYSFDVTNYSGEEVKVTATLNGHEEVIFEEYLPEATDAPARAAGEIKTFGGTLKAHHDALRNLSNAQVTLTATAGEKLLFAVTEAPHTTTGIEDVTVDSAAAAEFYNLNGMRVDATQLAPGIYIRKTGDKAEKVFVK